MLLVDISSTTMMEFNWYAVYTKPRWEKKVSGLITRAGIENYCPFRKSVRQWSDRKKIVEEPLFNSYVFVRISNKQHVAIREIDGIVNFVYWLQKPAVIRDEDIEMVKRFLNEYSNVRIERTVVNVHDRVKIVNGPFMEFEANVIKVNNKTVKIILPSLGYTMTAEKENVEVIS